MVVMWVVYFVMSYFLLALIIPVVWSAGRVYLRVRGSRNVTCPASQDSALISADIPFAVESHLLSDSQLRVARCSRWPDARACDQGCLTQI